MGLFNGTPVAKIIDLREDYKAPAKSIAVDEMASDVISTYKQGKRHLSWFYIHQLLKPVYGFPGIKDGTKCLLICSRDVRLDLLQELDKSWSDDKIRTNMSEIAKEQQHKAEKSTEQSLLQKSQLLISVSVGILVLAIVIIGVLKYYGG